MNLKNKYMLKVVGGFIYVCAYCGENCTSKVKYCPTCRTQEMRKKIFEQNLAIIKENKEKGHTVPSTLSDWH